MDGLDLFLISVTALVLMFPIWKEVDENGMPAWLGCLLPFVLAVAIAVFWYLVDSVMGWR